MTNTVRRVVPENMAPALEHHPADARSTAPRFGVRKSRRRLCTQH